MRRIRRPTRALIVCGGWDACPVVAGCFWPFSVTVTCPPALAVPQMGTGMPLWRTTWSLNSGAGLTSAQAALALYRSAKRDKTTN